MIFRKRNAQIKMRRAAFYIYQNRIVSIAFDSAFQGVQFDIIFIGRPYVYVVNISLSLKKCGKYGIIGCFSRRLRSDSGTYRVNNARAAMAGWWGVVV